MIRAMWDEVRTTIRLSFNAEVREAIRNRRSHPGWWADPHLRRGFYSAIPVFVAGMATVFVCWGSAIGRNVLLFYAYGLPFAVVANLTWFAVAAASRRRAGK